MKHDSSKKIEYTIGFLLLSIYILTTYVAVDIIISRSINTITLYAFLAWGLVTTMLYGIKKKIPTYTIWYACFMLVSLGTMIYSPETRIMSGEFYLMIVSFLITYFVQMFINNEKDFEKLCWVYAISSFAMVVMLQITGNLVGSAEERLGGELLDNANNFAIVIMIATMLELWLLVYNSNSILKKCLLSVVILYNMYALALSAGRKFFIMPFVFLYILLIFKRNKKGKRSFVLYTVITAIFALVAFFAIMKVPVLYESIGVRIEASFAGEEGKHIDDGAYYSSKLREEMREDAIEHWKERPIIGHGFDSYKFQARETVGKFCYSHCNYTELLHNGGIIYFLVYYWIFYKLLKDCFVKKHLSERSRAFALGVAICMIIFDYGAVSYSIASIQIVVALALKIMSFNADSTEQVNLEEK